MLRGMDQLGLNHLYQDVSASIYLFDTALLKLTGNRINNELKSANFFRILFFLVAMSKKEKQWSVRNHLSCPCSRYWALSHPFLLRVAGAEPAGSPQGLAGGGGDPAVQKTGAGPGAVKLINPIYGTRHPFGASLLICQFLFARRLTRTLPSPAPTLRGCVCESSETALQSFPLSGDWNPPFLPRKWHFSATESSIGRGTQNIRRVDSVRRTRRGSSVPTRYIVAWLTKGRNCFQR